MIENEKQNLFINELSRLVRTAFEYNARGESYSETVRMRVVDGSPDWKIVVSWNVGDTNPKVIVKQRMV